jgi:DivIVA domain-containing protein
MAGGGHRLGVVNAEALRAVQFREQLRGYAPQQVDDALEALVARVEAGGEIRAVDLDGLEFRRARLRGYHRGDVEEFVARLRSEAR